MRIGIFEIHRLRTHPVSGRRELPWDSLFQNLSPVAVAVIARVARSEVKNYLAEVAEQAELPYPGAADFVHQVHMDAALIQAAREDGLT